MTLMNLTTEIKNISKKHNMIMSVITENIDEMKKLSGQMKKINKEAIQPDSSINSNFNFPLSSVEEFVKLEEYLTDEKQFNSTVIEIARMGGADIYDFVKRSLSWVMKNSLLMKYTWYGTKDKSGLITTKFGQVIITSRPSMEQNHNTTVFSPNERTLVQDPEEPLYTFKELFKYVKRIETLVKSSITQTEIFSEKLDLVTNLVQRNLERNLPNDINTQENMTVESVSTVDDLRELKK
ncbi:unnamed protein product [Phaedon cochleariae]|uniref:DUF4806 domain-containing protein n=1 Tax=Phaedon cochleariae TaxID=80249 RepID=A0A9N9SE01_PHACE|nr:unnamed protein product [Phaedon cochleariae]